MVCIITDKHGYNSNTKNFKGDLCRHSHDQGFTKIERPCNLLSKQDTIENKRAQLITTIEQWV